MNTIKISFGLNNDSKNIFCQTIHENTTINSINKTAKFLKKYHDEWIDHTNKKRSLFNELNYFTNDQILLLRTKLSGLLINKKNTTLYNLAKKTVIDLMHNLNNEISSELSQSAYYYALDQSFDRSKQNNTDTNKIKTKKAKLIDKEKEEIFREILEDYNFSEELLFEAYNSLNDKNDKDALLMYCFEHQELSDDETKDNFQKDFINFNQISNKLIANKESLDEQYESVYECFLNHLECNFEDMLSLTSLGYILKYMILP